MPGTQQCRTWQVKIYLGSIFPPRRLECATLRHAAPREEPAANTAKTQRPDTAPKSGDRPPFYFCHQDYFKAKKQNNDYFYKLMTCLLNIVQCVTHNSPGKISQQFAHIHFTFSSDLMPQHIDFLEMKNTYCKNRNTSNFQKLSENVLLKINANTVPSGGINSGLSPDK